jgi:hypothetical protein
MKHLTHWTVESYIVAAIETSTDQPSQTIDFIGDYKKLHICSCELIVKFSIFATFHYFIFFLFLVVLWKIQLSDRRKAHKQYGMIKFTSQLVVLSPIRMQEMKVTTVKHSKTLRK